MRIFSSQLRAALFLGILATLRAEVPPADVLFAAATDAELQPLIAKLESPVTESRAAWQFWIGTISGKKVVLTRTEGDPLNAVAATTLAIRRYHPKLVVTYGTARAHDPSLQPGDLVVSSKFVAFDGLVSQVTPLDGGCTPLTWYKLPHLLATSGEKETPAYSFPADTTALAAAQNLTSARGKRVFASLGSAAQVNREADRIAWLHAEWGSDTEDGESAHIAGCAELLGVPAIGLRVIDGTDAEVAAAAIKFLEAWK